MKGVRNKLTAAQVLKRTEPGYLCDGGGLYLQIAPKVSSKAGRPSGMGVTKSWVFRYRDQSMRVRELGLGSLLDVPLAKAREKAGRMRELLEDGKDPKADRIAVRAALRAEAAKGKTFDEAAAACIEDKKAGWKNAKHQEQWKNTLATYASPIIGRLPVASIDLAHVRKVLDPIWTTKNETASRVRQRIESVLTWATVSGYRSGENPARWRGHLDHILPKPSKVQQKAHHAALPYSEIAAFMRDLRGHHGYAALALEFTILTAARTTEVIQATWDEVDLVKKVWTVSAKRMKAGKEHVVPLSARAVAILTKLEKTRAGAFIFLGGREGTPLSNMAMAALLKRMDRTEITVHGFRSTFRDWAAEQTATPREVIEHALAHQLKDKAEAAYHRSTLLEKRRELMEAWAGFCQRGSREKKN